MEVTTNLTRKDFIKASLLFAPKQKIYYFIILGMFSVLFYSQFLEMISEPNAIFMLIFMGVVRLLLSILSGVVMIFLGIAIVILMSNKSGIFSQNEITISEQGISSKTELSESTIKWKLVKSIQAVKSSYLIIGLSTCNFILPKRDIDSEEAFEEFTKQATLYWNNANGKLKEDR